MNHPIALALILQQMAGSQRSKRTSTPREGHDEFREEHPFGHFIPPNAKTLIIGTFPPGVHRWAYPFFYPNPRNLMWGMLAGIAGVSITASTADPVEVRRSILIKLQAGITDMGKVIRRTQGNASDENLELIELMHILELLDAHPTISKLILTSSSGPVSALRWFSRHLTEHSVQHKVPAGKKPFTFEFSYNKKTYRAYVLYSPSPRAANRISAEAMAEMYGNVLLS